MTRPLRVVGLNGSYGRPSKTASLVDAIIAEQGRLMPIESRRFDVAFLGAGLSTALDRAEVDAQAEEALRAVEGADLVIAASPVYRGSYSGLFKHFVDLLDQYALADTPVILAATGGSERHQLMLDHELRPLFAFLQAHISPCGVYASDGDFAGGELLNPQVQARIELAVRDLRPLLQSRLMDDARIAAERQVVSDPVR